MKKRYLLLIAMFVGVAVFFAAAGLYAANKAADEIKMENPAYAKHKKGIVMFTHKKHAVDYAAANPDLYKNKCGECHHDKDNKPLSALKDGDAVENCLACHKITTPKPKGKKLKKKEKLQYHAEAIHMNCKGCHKAFNKAKGSKAAPTTCAKCHPKKKK